MKEDNNALFLRYERVVQARRGYSAPDTLSGGRLSSRYLGSPDKLLLRYRVSRAKDFSLGITAEKDAGEPLAWQPGQRRYGADFVSAHFVVQERGRLKTLALGDYQLQFGQGLLLSSGLQVGKGGEDELRPCGAAHWACGPTRRCWKARFFGARRPPWP